VSAVETLGYKEAIARLLREAVAADPNVFVLGQDVGRLSVGGARSSRPLRGLRERAFPVPVQLIWARNDPLASAGQGMALFKLLAERPPATQFHVINRSGSFPFREQPEALHAVVSALHDGIAAER
jgi:pimeloyl-ACP methyl ester carboxylesterase